MGRVLKEPAITTRNARAALPAGLYWRGIDAEVHLGYRKKKRGGSWLARWRVGTGYRQAALGTADDVLAEGTLSYEAALRAARMMVETARAEARIAAEGPVPTVRTVVAAYIDARNARDTRRAGRAVRSDASRRLELHLLGKPAARKRAAVAAAPLADIELNRVSEKALRDWRNGLPDGLKASTRQRLINDLKAALNGGCAVHRDRLDPSLLAIVKNGLKAEKLDDDDTVPRARENQILNDTAIAHLISAARDVDRDRGWDGDLFRIVVVLAATGARFSQVARMRVGDCQAAASRLLVPASRKGRGNKSGAITVPVGPDVLDALAPIVMGRPPAALLLQRWTNEQVRGSVEWRRAGRRPWHSSSELVRPWQNIRDRAKMPDVIPYALRHSSIVKGIRANLPIRLVAALHDTSTAMVERHYAKWITSGLEDMARSAIVPLVIDPASNVVAIRAKEH